MSADEKIKHELETVQKELEATKGVLSKKEHSEALVKLMNEKKISPEFFDVFSEMSDLEKASGAMDNFNSKFNVSDKNSTCTVGKIL